MHLCPNIWVSAAKHDLSIKKQTRHLSSLSLSHLLLASISQAAAANVTAGLKWAPETDANE